VTSVYYFNIVECALRQVVVWSCKQKVQDDGNGTGMILWQLMIHFLKFILLCSESTITVAFASSHSRIWHWHSLQSLAAVDFMSAPVLRYQLIYIWHWKLSGSC